MAKGGSAKGDGKKAQSSKKRASYPSTHPQKANKMLVSVLFVPGSLQKPGGGTDSAASLLVQKDQPKRSPPTTPASPIIAPGSPSCAMLSTRPL